VLGQQGVEGDEEIEIDVVQFHNAPSVRLYWSQH
jgi:hypothetical protein